MYNLVSVSNLKPQNNYKPIITGENTNATKWEDNIIGGGSTEKMKVRWEILGYTGGSLAALLFVCVLVCLIFRRKNQQNSQSKLAKDQPFSYKYFLKIRDLKKELVDYLNDSTILKQDFDNLERHALEQISPNHTIEVAHNDRNKAHNRYQDISPFDDNLITLSTDAG